MRLFSFVFTGLVVLAVLVSTSRCGTTATSTNYSYAGPGSHYTLALNADLTFTLTHAADAESAVSLTVTGTYTRLASGFLLMTVGSSSGSEGPTAGDQAYGLEIPGFTVIMKPVGESDDHLIPLVISGGCPSADFTANWIIAKKSNSQSASSTTQDFFGTFSFDFDTNFGTLPTKYALQGFSSISGGGSVGGTTCSGGLMKADDANMYLTANGGAIVHTGHAGGDGDQSFILALPSSEFVGTDATAEYAGLAFNSEASVGSGGRIFPVSVSLTGTSSAITGTGTKVADVEANTLTSETVTINLSSLNSPSAGFATGTITAGSSGALSCTIDTDVVGSGKNMMACVGQSPGDTTEMFGLLLVTK